MDLRTYLAIIRKYLPLLVISGLVGLLLGYLAYVVQPKQYAADVQFYVSTPVPEQGSAQSAGQFATNRMVSYAELLQSQELGDRVAKATGVDLTGAQVARRITANTTVDSVLVKATVTDTDRDRALTIAQGIDEVFGPMVDELDNGGRKVPVVTVNTVSAPLAHPSPVAPKSRTLLLLGLGTGVLLALGFALLRELLDTSVKDEAELRDTAGAPVIATITADKSAAATPLVGRTGVRAEEHRKLRTNLNFLGATERAKVLAFTGPADGVGTSTVAANTAISFAETGGRVCLVQADMRRADDLGLATPGGTGLSSVLAGEVSLERALRRAEGGVSIDVLPAGELPPNPAALLGHPRFGALLEALRQRYDHVVIDTPALLPTADASTVAGRSDGVVLVVGDGRTTANEVQRSRAALETVGAHLFGVVNNRARQAQGALAGIGGR